MKELDLDTLLSDESFLNFCFQRNSGDMAYWENFLKENPTYSDQIDEAKTAVLLMNEPVAEKVIESDYSRLQDSISGIGKKHIGGFRLWPYISVAASIALIVVGAYFYNDSRKETSKQNVAAIDVSPGIQTATLTLADGKKIRLADKANGELAKESGVSIIKTAEGQLVYDIKNSSKQTNQINTLSTANGETYQVRLPDGTAAWLNAASSISYPASFAALKTRNVQTTGEVYFEVAKDKVHPFIVETNGQKIEVLGTHFNVNSYANESQMKTTLLEGSIKIKGRDGQLQLLRPGQQATLSKSGQLKVADGDVQLAVAWKNNKFMFESQQIKDIMRMIERWYDVEVVYEGSVPDDRFSGKVSRYSNVSQVLKLLEQSGGVHFRIAEAPGKGKTIYVSK